jgi:hypothetical protein
MTRYAPGLAEELAIQRELAVQRSQGKLER